MAAEDYSDLIAAADDYSDLVSSQAGRVDMSPAARRARAGMASGPREVSAEEAGTLAGPIKTNAAQGTGLLGLASTSQEPAPADVGAVDFEVAERFPRDRTLLQTVGLERDDRPMVKMRPRIQNELDDPTAQSVMLSTVLGPFGRAAAASMAPRVGAVPAGVSAGAAEAALGAKASGGDAGDAALFGGLFGGIGAAGSARPSATAAAKNDVQVIKDIKRGATKAPKGMADEVDFRADQLIESSKDSPDVRKALVTKSRSNPGAAEGAVRKARQADLAANDADYAAIEKHHGPLPLNAVTDRLADLEARFYQEGSIPAYEATGRVLDKLNRTYGGNAGSTLTAAQLRKIRNDLGDIAFPGVAKEARPSASRGALRDVYDEFNGAIEDVASMTPGVDVAALKARNRRISSLEPAQNALGERVSLEADRELSLYGAAKDRFKKAVTGANRSMRYGRETRGGGGGDNPLLFGAPAIGPLSSPASQGTPEMPRIPAALAAQLLLNGGLPQ